MENLKDWIYYLYDIIKPILIITLGILACCFLANGIYHYAIEIDESKLSDIRYCPSCGIDLINVY